MVGEEGSMKKPENAIIELGIQKAFGCAIVFAYFEYFTISFFILCFSITFSFKKKNDDCNWVEVN